ncbi:MULTISPECIES: amino acid ABC transporter permease [unclassified Frankia]|uniref:amino acid ABC transporter permease n=2 Tax=unclassified Frankia TaxID=2632575 RepID=UPI002AD26F1B|nr:MULTISPECIES: amino acid ABC transporter permease [unclassified Frankia]
MGVITDNVGLYAHGLLGTLKICGLAAVGALLLGIVLAVFRVSPVAPLRATGTAYVTLVRNCPLTIVLFFFAFGLPEVGINGAYLVFGVAGLAVYTAAFVCEALRSGIGAVDAGQAEAARAIGLTFGQSLRLIVLPQAVRAVIPPLGSVAIAMIKNSAILGAFGVGGELYSVANTLNSARGEPALPVYTGVVIGYLIIIIPAGLLLGVLEKRMTVAR